MNVIKILMSLLLIIFSITPCFANPLPVFALFGWLFSNPGYNGFYEYEPNSYYWSKKYELAYDAEGTIYEYEPNSYYWSKKYELAYDAEGTIYEYEPNSYYWSKKYELAYDAEGTIYEYEPNSYYWSIKYEKNDICYY